MHFYFRRLHCRSNNHLDTEAVYRPIISNGSYLRTVQYACMDTSEWKRVPINGCLMMLAFFYLLQRYHFQMPRLRCKARTAFDSFALAFN